MKKSLLVSLVLISLLIASGCSINEGKAQNNEVNNSAVAAEGTNTETPIILTINGAKLKAVLNNSAPAQALKKQLPKTVHLNDSGNDFCGDSLDLQYSSSDVKNGYKNGDIAYWPPAHNFVIFVKDEEKSASTGNLVILGHINESQNVLNSLHGNLEVKIEEVK